MSNDTYLVIDALDECQVDLPKLLDYIVKASSDFPRVRWILSSRNSPNMIQERLGRAAQTVKLDLELNETLISFAVKAYIKEKVDKLFQLKEFDDKTGRDLEHQLASRSNNTFLWVALACQRLEEVSPFKLLRELDTLPPSLDGLYEEMMNRIRHSNPSDATVYRRILAVVSTVYRPITLHELASLVETLDPRNKDNIKYLIDEVKSCGTFLTLRGSTIYFVHQSAKDFLLNRPDEIFPSGREEIHHSIFSQSLRDMSQTLRRDMYDLGAPEMSIDKIKKPNPDTLATVYYSCLYWVDHLLDSGRYQDIELLDGTSIHDFLSREFLHWLEALSLGGNLSSGVLTMNKLIEALAAKKLLVEHSQHLALAEDARRFLLYWRSDIENWPLQTYFSALIFSPKQSLIRQSFEKNEIEWVNIEGSMIRWPPVLQTLHTQNGSSLSLAFSPNGQRLATGTRGGCVRIWDAITGELLQTFQCSEKGVDSLVFLPGSQCLAAGSGDEKIRLWDADTGSLLQTLAGHSNPVRLRASSSDGTRLVLESPFGQNIAQLWDVCASALLRSLESAEGVANSEALLSQAKPLGCSSGPARVEWLSDKPLLSMNAADWTSILALAFSDWINILGLLLPVIAALVLLIADEGNLSSLVVPVAPVIPLLVFTYFYMSSYSPDQLPFKIAFSPGNRRIALGFDQGVVQLCDSDTGAILRTFTNKSSFQAGRVWLLLYWLPPLPNVVLFSFVNEWRPNFWFFALGWPFLSLLGCVAVSIGAIMLIDDDAPSTFWPSSSTIAFSPDGRLLALGSSEGTIRLRNAATGALLQIFQSHAETCCSLVFSPDSKRLASGSSGGIVHVWHITSSIIRPPRATTPIKMMAFSLGGEFLASMHQYGYYGMAQLWNTTSGTLLRILGNMNRTESPTSAAALFNNGKRLVLGFESGSTRLYDTDTGAVLQTLGDQMATVTSLTLSFDGQLLASGSDAVRLWYMSTLWVTFNGCRLLSVLPWRQTSNRPMVDKLLIWFQRLWLVFGVFYTIYTSDAPVGHSSYCSIPFAWIILSCWSEYTLVPDGTLHIAPATSHIGANPIAFSPDGKHLACGHDDGRVRIWLVHVIKWRVRLREFGVWIQAIILSVSLGSVVQLNYWVTLADKDKWKGGDSMGTIGCFMTPAACLIGIPLRQRFPTIFPQRVQAVEAHSGMVHSVSFSPDGQWLASAFIDSIVLTTRMNIENGPQERAYSAATSFMSFSANSKMVTDRGIVDVESLPDQPDQPQTLEDKWEGWGFSKDRRWITWRGKNVICLPPEYHPESVAVAEWKVAIGGKSGRVIILNFAADSDLGRYFTERLSVPR